MIKMKKVFSSHAQKGKHCSIVSVYPRLLPVLNKIPHSIIYKPNQSTALCSLWNTPGTGGLRFVVLNSQRCFLKHDEASSSPASPLSSLTAPAIDRCFELEFTLFVQGEISSPKLTNWNPKNV